MAPIATKIVAETAVTGAVAGRVEPVAVGRVAHPVRRLDIGDVAVRLWCVPVRSRMP